MSSRPAPTSGEVRVWSAGVPVLAQAPDDWALRSAEFLGCGFRVAVPAGAGLLALEDARGRVQELADLLGATVDDIPWTAAAHEVGGARPVLLEGGWEAVFRAPLGPPLTRLLPGRAPASPRSAPAVEVPWRVQVGSPLSQLPLHSTHEDLLARGHVAAHAPGAVALWRTPTGELVRTGAGFPFLHLDGVWWRPAPGPGVVDSWLVEETAARLGAQECALPVRDAWVTDAGDTDALLVAVDRWGSLTVLTGPTSPEDVLARPAVTEMLSTLTDGA